MSTTLQPGDRVRYARAFLRNVHCRDPQRLTRRATVVAIEPELRPRGPRPVVVQWDDADGARRVLSCNLERLTTHL